MMYETGNYTAIELGKLFPITNVAISALLKRNGYKAKSQSELQRKYSILENFFDNIDTEEKAYILGLLYADGCNQTNRNSVSLSLKETDKDILERITSLIQPTKPLQYVNMSRQRSREGFENSQNQYRLVIANKHISQRLVELGCGKAKTHNLTFPTEEQVPSCLIRHFIRGYFDGDGCISGAVKKIDIVGTEDFLKTVQGILLEKLEIKESKLNRRYKERENRIRCLQISGRHQVGKFKDFIYKDATIFLNRKRDNFYNAALNIKSAGVDSDYNQTPRESKTACSNSRGSVDNFISLL